jgi:Kef-type K+ transport system membrane component KefB
MQFRVASQNLAVVLAAAVGLLLVGVAGADLTAPAPAAGQATYDAVATEAKVNPLPHVLLALVAIVLVARLTGIAFHRLGQPPVIGEMLAGILLGPSLFGRLFPSASAFLLPPAIEPLLGILAQVGVVLFLFLVGVELDTSLLRRRTRASLAIANASITVPLLAGGALALVLYPTTSTNDVPFLPFALFVAVAMSVTAFPVLARILADSGLAKSELGVVALACAALNDVAAWCLLAIVVGVAKATAGAAVLAVALALLFTGTMLLIVRPLVARWVRAQTDASSGSTTALATVLFGILVSALAAEAIGIHAMFGAFLFGAIVPHDSRLAHAATGKIHDLVVVLFLPMFFAFTGLRTEIGLVSGAEDWLLCGLVIVVATASKFGGTWMAARLCGVGRRDAAGLGALMNTRGLMELVVLNVGLDLRIVSPTLFAMMVAMALVTTLLTTPALRLLGLIPRDGRAGGASAPPPPAAEA